jgi:hypothetical protein
VQVHGVKDGRVAGERFGQQAGVRVRDAGLLEELDLLVHLRRLVLVKLALLAQALGCLVLVLGLAREEVAQAHADAVRDEVREAHEQRRLDRQARARHGRDDREGRDYAIKPAKDDRLDALAARAAVVLGRVRRFVKLQRRGRGGHGERSLGRRRNGGGGHFLFRGRRGTSAPEWIREV